MQVVEHGLCLLKGIEKVAEIASPDGRYIARASACERYVLCLLDDGEPWLVQLDAQRDELRVMAIGADWMGEEAMEVDTKGATAGAKAKGIKPSRLLAASLRQ